MISFTHVDLPLIRLAPCLRRRPHPTTRLPSISENPLRTRTNRSLHPLLPPHTTPPPTSRTPRVMTPLTLACLHLQANPPWPPELILQVRVIANIFFVIKIFLFLSAILSWIHKNWNTQTRAQSSETVSGLALFSSQPTLGPGSLTPGDEKYY